MTTHRARARTDTAGRRFVDPKVLARIDNLELVARTVVDGFMSGLHRSPYLGLSLDFAEHRAYQPGDDIRRVDWRLFARTDRFYVKQFEADTNANVTLILDVSRSMAFGGEEISKLDYARYLAASLAVFSGRQRDRVGLTTFDQGVVDFVPPAQKHLEEVLHHLDRAEAGRQGSLAGPLLEMAASFRRRGILILISDFYEEPEDVLEAVKHLRYRGNDLIAFHVLDPAEIDFPYERAGAFQDLESGETVPVVPEDLREEYRSLVEEHVAELRRRFTENAIDYALFDTGTPLDFALFQYLSARQRMSRVR